MNWDRVKHQWRRVIGYLKSKLGSDSEDRGDSTPSGKGWLDGAGRPGFPQAPEPAFARIPK